MITEEIYIPKLKLNIKFYIGKNAQENFTIIDLADGKDMWFHLNDYPSCHVIGIISNLSLDKKELKYIITQGALLCKKYSKYKSEPNINVVYTTINNVKKTEIIGTVNLSNTKLIIV